MTRKGKIWLGVTGLLLVVPTTVAILPFTASLQEKPGDRCYRLYGYDKTQQLGCLELAAEQQARDDDATIAAHWRATH